MLKNKKEEEYQKKKDKVLA